MLHVSFAKEKKRKKREREKRKQRRERDASSLLRKTTKSTLPCRDESLVFDITLCTSGTVERHEIHFRAVKRERERRIHLERIQIYVAKRNRPHPSQLSSPSDPATLSPRHELPTIYLLCYERHRFSCNSRSEIFSVRIASSIAF